MGAQEHRQKAGRGPVTVAIVTVSDTRTPESDENRRYIERRMAELGHTVAAYRLIKDEPDQVAAVLDELAAALGVQIILFNGGTGISPRDTTYDVISRYLEKTLPGFGELFRMFSYQEVGAAAMFSRATAGIYRGTLVFSMPGSPNAVQVALEKLILPEINHLAWEVARKS
ncbi:MAG: MogA/MoaB family molybdenum cofactor biosynthesis protein [Chloroflexi bacterium]|nr:MogA/MoaB family molybdenum cofactor biosynthesis protein [Chloroflexota bacterium]MDL1884177.1 MogA/MoaB family molybdenum cofactor biosynthesis protein [Anaerolineae bacterium CFX8]